MNKASRGGGSAASGKPNRVTHVKSFKHAGGKLSINNRGKAPFKNTGKGKSDKEKVGPAKDFASWKESVSKDDKGKTNWNDLKAEMKTLREKRRKNKKQTFYESYNEVKKLWEKLRLHSCEPEEKEKLCVKIMELIKGNIKMIAKSHDMARIIQWLVKLGSDSVREQILSEMSDDMVNLSKNKYTKHAVKSLLQHCSPNIKKKVVQKCSGNIYSLTCNKVSAPLVEEMYKVAGPKEKAAMIKEFYGGIESDINLTSSPIKDEVTAALLNKSSKFLNTLIDKGHCMQMNLVHSVLYDFLNKCNNKTDMINNLKSHFRALLSSKDGVKIFSMILFESTAKEKKNIVKEFKSDMKELSIGEHSSIALLLLIDSVDDTVLIKKALIPGILENLETIVTNEHGRKVIVYLMVHRDQKYFHPKDIGWLSQFDSSPNVKKDSDQKVREIQEVLLVPLSEKISANPKFWFNDSSIAMVTLSIVKTLKGQHRINALTAIADFIMDSKSSITENENVLPVVEHPGTHMVIKKIIANDKNIDYENDTFTKILTKKLDSVVIERWIQSNRGCFTLVSMFETQLPETIKKLQKKLALCASQLDSQSSKGSQILKKYISPK